MIRKKLKLAESKRAKNESNDSHESDNASPFFMDRKQPGIWQQLYDIECRMSQELSAISFKTANVSAVYNPIEYASDLHCAYMQKFLNEAKAVVFIGMNPGPFGMVQTGVTNSYHQASIHLDTVELLNAAQLEQTFTIFGRYFDGIRFLCCSHGHRYRLDTFLPFATG